MTIYLILAIVSFGFNFLYIGLRSRIFLLTFHILLSCTNIPLKIKVFTVFNKAEEKLFKWNFIEKKNIKNNCEKNGTVMYIAIGKMYGMNVKKT